MADATSSIQHHYGADRLAERMLEALAAAGHDTANPTVDMLNLVDQLHGGGLNSTKLQAEIAGVTRSTRVLDAGCGVGGSSRYLAGTFGCRVEAIDLTTEFVETARRLNDLCGLSDMISTRQGDVTDLPFDDRSFDLVWCQNVTMNIADKPGLFAETYRVLAPGGRYAFSHAARGPAGEPYFPLPWARDASYSFLGTQDEVLGWLDDAGFRLIETRGEGGGVAVQTAQQAPANALGPGVIMGPDMPERMANASRSAKDGRLVSMLVVAERPG